MLHSTSSPNIQESPASISPLADEIPLLAFLQERQRARATDAPQRGRKRAFGKAFRLQTTSNTSRRSDIESPLASNTGDADVAVERVLQSVRELGRLPREYKKPATEAECAECRLAKQVRYYKLQKQARKELKDSKATKDTTVQSRLFGFNNDSS